MTTENVVVSTTGTANTEPIQPNTGDATGTNSGGESGKAEAQTSQTSKTYTEADIEKIVTERLQRDRRLREDASNKAIAAAERKAAEEQGKFQELYQRTMAELETERQQRRATELTLLKREVGAKFGLPAALVDRLQGDDEDAIAADAKALSAALPKAPAPNINSAAGAPVAAKSAMADEMIREKAARYGVSPELFKQNYRPIGGQ